MPREYALLTAKQEASPRLVLAPRILAKNYGTAFLHTLPKWPIEVVENHRLTRNHAAITIFTMTITIPDELDEFVRAKLQAGEFENPAAVVTAALTAWQGQEVFRAMDRDEVERQLLEAIDTPRIPWDEANFDRIIESLREKHKAA